MHVLVIEDNQSEAVIFSRALEKVMDAPVKVHTSDTLEEGVGFIRDHDKKLDMVFVDLGLPDAHGWDDICKAIRPYMRDIPFVVVTGDDNPEVARELLRNGFEDYIVKGGPKRSLSALREVIDYARCRHEAMRALNSEKEQESQCIRWLTGSYSA